MTPRSQSSPGGHPVNANNDIDLSTTNGPHSDNSGDEEEVRPSHTAEIGTLKKLSVPGGTAWLGSSSGVYFVNTVRRAFSAAFAEAGTSSSGDVSVPASEDILTGEDASGLTSNGPVHEGPNTTDQDFQRMMSSALGQPPSDRKLAMELVTTFFRSWHPLFPFLHGPRFLADMEQIYLQTPRQRSNSRSGHQSFSPTNPHQAASRQQDSHSTSNTSATASSGSFLPHHPSYPNIDPRKLITFQLVINIAALDPTSPTLPLTSRIKSTADVTRMAGSLALNHDINTIQALLAAELYLVATIALRQASTIAGIVLRMIYHSGLHRCPLRYAALTVHDCEIRKRIFWSAYALDRHLSLALGDPNTFQDSDIDVCLSSGRELHRAVARELIPPEQRGEEYRLHLPSNYTAAKENTRREESQSQSHSGTPKSSHGGVPLPSSTSTGQPTPPSQNIPYSTSNPNPMTASPLANDTDQPRVDAAKQLREAALTAYVHYGKLTGRIIEIFHKSINFRFPKQDAIGYLTADIENWWNDLPGTLTGEGLNPTANESDAEIDKGIIEQHKQLTPFFTLLYHQLLLLLNRPRLSLDQSTAEFQQGLQVCIRASRHTLSALNKHKENGQSMFLPGMLSAAWMAGLIIAFACQLGKYPKARACADIRSCLDILETMNIRWFTVKNCHKVLSLLLSNIQGRRATITGYLSANRGEFPGTVPATSQPTPTLTKSRKRHRDSMSIDDNLPSPKRDSISEPSPASSADFRASSTSHFPSPQQRSMGNTFVQPSLPQYESTKSNISFDIPNWGMSSSGMGPAFSGGASNPFTSGMGATSAGRNTAGAALYADPRDITFAQNTHTLNLNNTASASSNAMNHNLPELHPSHTTGSAPLANSNNMIDDQMFWGNLDSNLLDVFGAVSWENMMGSGWMSGGNGVGMPSNNGFGLDMGMGYGDGTGTGTGTASGTTKPAKRGMQ